MKGSSAPKSIAVGDFRITDVVFPPLLKLAPHCHERACFAVVLEGAVRKSFRHSTHDLSAPGTVTMPAEEWHEDFFAQSGAHILVVEAAPGVTRRFAPLDGVFERVHLFRNPGLCGIA